MAVRNQNRKERRVGMLCRKRAERTSRFTPKPGSLAVPREEPHVPGWPRQTGARNYPRTRGGPTARQIVSS